MTDDKHKEPRTAKPESLEAKFKLLALLPYDRRAKRKHSLVFGFILDWYHSKYGDALASVRHVTSTIKERDPAGEGIGIRHVQDALTDLVAWGYLDQQKGAGRRASRYVPVWAKLDSVSPVGIHNDNGISVSPVGNTSVSPVGNTTGDSVSPVGNEDPSTVTRSQDRVNGKMDKDCAAATPPPAPPANAADAAGTPGGDDQFKALWKTYYPGTLKGKGGWAEAEAEYRKLAPDAELHTEILESAREWYERWAAQDKPDAPRYTLAKWIARKEYLCEPPTAYKPKERKAKAANPTTPTAEPAKDIPTFMRGSPRLWPVGTHSVEVIGVDKGNDGGDEYVLVWFMIVSGDGFGAEYEHKIWTKSCVSSAQAEGQGILRGLRQAAGLHDEAELEALESKRLTAMADGDSITYLPAPLAEAA